MDVQCLFSLLQNTNFFPPIGFFRLWPLLHQFAYNSNFSLLSVKNKFCLSESKRMRFLFMEHKVEIACFLIFAKKNSGRVFVHFI